MHKEDKFINIDNFEIFPWNKNFESGFDNIDNQHKKLVGIINELARTLVENNEIDINNTFNQLVDYAEYHFSDEEEFWVKYLDKSNHFSNHRIEHASFIPQILKIRSQRSHGSLIEEIEGIFKFLIRWLTFHIVDCDKRMAIMTMAIADGQSKEEAQLKADEEMGGTTRVFIDTLLMMYEGLSLNAIYLLNERRARKKAEEDLIIANQRLEELSITDHLTGLFNRRHFTNVFNKEFLRARRDGNFITLIEFDVDYFKMYNDNYGHSKGDRILEVVGKTLIEACRRPDDYAFRLGGEEFAVIAINMDPDKALDFAENIRHQIEHLNIEHKYSTVKNVLTVSGGMVNKIPTINDSYDEFFNAADAKLYEAKKNGRNQIKS